MPRYKAVGWFGLMAPAGTPAGIVSKLSDVVAARVQKSGRHHGVARAGHRARAAAGRRSLPAFVRDQLELHRQLVKDVDLKISE